MEAHWQAGSHSSPVSRAPGRAHAPSPCGAGADIIGVDVCATLDGVEYPMSQPDDLKEQ